jgi:hypothetical protein
MTAAYDLDRLLDRGGHPHELLRAYQVVVAVGAERPESPE